MEREKIDFISSLRDLYSIFFWEKRCYGTVLTRSTRTLYNRTGPLLSLRTGR